MLTLVKWVEKLTVNQQTRVRGLVGTRELDASRLSRARALNTQLVAGHVVLGTVLRASGMEGHRLSTEEVVAGRNVAGDDEVLLTTPLVDEIVGPSLVSLEVTALEDLEELARTVSGGGIIDGTEVDHNGTVVSTTDSLLGAIAIIVLVHLDGDGVTGLDATGGASGGRVGIATHVVGSRVLDRGVGRRHADASAGLVFSVDPELLEDGMASNHVGHGSGECESDGCLHLGRLRIRKELSKE